jgi:signal transduction histidine kinase/CheY-like chemotaxis protein
VAAHADAVAEAAAEVRATPIARVLVVDDHAASLEAVSAILEPLELDVVRAHSGPEALRACLRDDFAAVVLDVQMPGMDGFEVAALLRARPRTSHTPILFLTGESASDIAAMRAYTSGAVDYLVKPPEPAVLRSKVAVFADLWRRAEEIREQERTVAEMAAREERRRVEEEARAQHVRAEAALAAERERAALIQEAVAIALFTRQAGNPPRVVWVSPNVERVLGYPARTIIAEPSFWWGRVHPDDRERVRAAHAEVSHDGPIELDYRWQGPDGEHRWYQERSVHRGGAVLGTWLLVHEQKMLEEALRTTNEELEARVERRTAELAARNEELEAFASAVSHDLRAPLRAIAGFSSILAQSTPLLPPEGLQALERIQGGVRRMGALIDDLLALSRVSRVELHRERVDLSAVAGEVIAELRERDPKRNVVAHVDPGLVVEADPGLTRVLLENLLGNAWKFSRGREPARVEVRGETREGETVIAVADNGVGFDMAWSGHLFRPFHRLHDPTEYEGTGIGLATAARIVRRHRGHIEAQASPDKGATFRFTLGEAERRSPPGTGG